MSVEENQEEKEIVEGPVEEENQIKVENQDVRVNVEENQKKIKNENPINERSVEDVILEENVNPIDVDVIPEDFDKHQPPKTYHPIKL